MIAGRLRRARAVLRRATPGPLLVRAGIYAVGLAGLLLAYPVVLLASRLAVPLVLLPALPALAPRGRTPTVVVLVTVAGWLLSTLGYGEPVTLWRPLGLAALLYLGHSLAALAAALPYDAVVAPQALTRWLVRAGLVAVGSALLGLVVVAGADLLRGAHLAATVAGLLLAAGLAALLAWLPRRPASADHHLPPRGQGDLVRFPPGSPERSP